MEHPVLAETRDRSLARALRRVIRGKPGATLTVHDVDQVLRATDDFGGGSHAEFRDLKRILRQRRLDRAAIRRINTHLQFFYRVKGPFVYPGTIEDLEGHAKFGNGQCPMIVTRTIPIGSVLKWREGIPVRGNGHLIRKGTAVATFEDGFYANRAHGNHVAYYISQNSTGILVMDQWKAKSKVSSRRMRFLGRKGNGLFRNPSNNGDALSVIMVKY